MTALIIEMSQTNYKTYDKHNHNVNHLIMYVSTSPAHVTVPSSDCMNTYITDAWVMCHILWLHNNVSLIKIIVMDKFTVGTIQLGQALVQSFNYSAVRLSSCAHFPATIVSPAPMFGSNKQVLHLSLTSFYKCNFSCTSDHVLSVL